MTAVDDAPAGVRGRRASRWLLAALALLAIALVAMQVQRHLPFSPYDEYVYFDYVTKIPTQGMVVSGEETGALARAELECRGVALYGSFGDGCGVGDVADDELFPYEGLTGADLYTPVYFAITWLAAQPLTWFGMGLLDAARAVGGLWLAATVALIFLSARRVGASPAAATGIALLCLAAPVVQSAFGYISTDAAAITAGAAIAYVTARILTGGTSVWWLLPVGVLGVLAKVHAIGALGAALLIVTLHASIALGGWRDRGVRLRVLLPAVIAAVAAVAAQLLWMVVRSSSAVGPGAQLGVGVPGLPPEELLRQLTHVILNVGATQPVQDNPTATVAVTIATLVAGAGLLAGIVGFPRSPELGERAKAARSWSIGTLILALVMIPMLSLMIFALDGIYFDPPLRYGAALLPFLLLAAAPLLTRSRWLAIGLGTASLVLVVLAWI